MHATAPWVTDWKLLPFIAAWPRMQFTWSGTHHHYRAGWGRCKAGNHAGRAAWNHVTAGISGLRALTTPGAWIVDVVSVRFGELTSFSRGRPGPGCVGLRERAGASLTHAGAPASPSHRPDDRTDLVS